ncbi:MAG: molecular chaperone, partial [Thermoanaerobaculum sp.]
MKRWLFLLPALLPGCALAGALAVSPPRLDITLVGSQAAEAVKVVNLDAAPIHLKVSVAHWRLDEHNRLELIPPTPQSADQWLLITPLEFVVEPGKSQTLRILVRPRVKPEAGEHRAMVFLEEQPPPTEELVTRNLARV